MATASVTTAKVGKPAATTPAVQVNAPTRREFLYYIWGASMVLLLGQASAGLIWFSLPRFREGEFGGTFTYDESVLGDYLPEPGAAPTNIPSGRFWLSNVQDAGFVALYGVCTHLGCLPKWNDTNYRFECPCHGSKYEIDGLYIEGPAPRSLDRFETTLTFDDGSTAVTNADGDPIAIPAERRIVKVAVDTGKRIRRNGRV